MSASGRLDRRTRPARAQARDGREALLEAAARVFARRGFRDASVDDIAREAGFSKGAVYWHERWQNLDQSYSNLRVNSSVESLQAYHDGVANSDWLGNLNLRALPKK